MAEAFVLTPADKGLVLRFTQLDPLGFLGSAGLWTGLIAAGALLAGATRLRRNREPI
jgi:hypothetical protein